MSRIRSTHPSQWTDEDFVACSPMARLFLLGLRNVADDRGVFEWRPASLRMQILPGDQVDAAALLGELVDNRQIAGFEVDGRAYGLCLLWDQQPRRPHYRYPAPPEGLRSATIPDNDGNGSDSGDTETAPIPTSVARNGNGNRNLESGGEPRASAQEAPPPEDLPEDWREEARRQRAEAGKPEADLDEQWRRFRNEHRDNAGRITVGRWLNWADDARPAVGAGLPDSAVTAGRTAPPGPLAAFWADLPGANRHPVEWLVRLKSWFEGGRWLAIWGDPPGERTCLAPVELVRHLAARRAANLASRGPAAVDRTLTAGRSNGAGPARPSRRKRNIDPAAPEILMPLPGGAGAQASEEERAEAAGYLDNLRKRGAA